MTTTANARRGPEFGRQRLPERFCNLDRLLADMEARELDGLVVTTPLNVFWLTSFNGIAHKGDEPRPYVVILARREPEHPIMVLADYYLTTPLYQPTWVKDIRPCRSVMAAMDRPPRRDDIDAHIPRSAAGIDWVERARAAYRYDFSEQVRGALRDLGIDRGRVGFDDEGFGRRLGLEDVEVADGYDPLMHARAVKTPDELELLARATRLNEKAIRRTVSRWEKGWTRQDLNHAYAVSAVELGGFVRDPGALVVSHATGDDPTLTVQSGLEDEEIALGTHVMFDCHGTLDLYCWDGGKSWVVGGEPTPEGAKRLAATGEVAAALVRACGPARGSASCRRWAATSTARRAWRTRTAPLSSSMASGYPTSTSSSSIRTASPTGTGCWRSTWCSPCTCSIRAASASGRGWRKSSWWNRMAADRCSVGASSR